MCSSTSEVGAASGATSNVLATRRGVPHSGQYLNVGAQVVPHSAQMSRVGTFLIRVARLASASRMSAADANRSLGCFASALATIPSSSLGTWSRRAASDGTIALRWLARISVVEPAKNGVL